MGSKYMTQLIRQSDNELIRILIFPFIILIKSKHFISRKAISSNKVSHESFAKTSKAVLVKSERWFQSPDNNPTLLQL